MFDADGLLHHVEILLQLILENFDADRIVLSDAVELCKHVVLAEAFSSLLRQFHLLQLKLHSHLGSLVFTRPNVSGIMEPDRLILILDKDGFHA